MAIKVSNGLKSAAEYITDGSVILMRQPNKLEKRNEIAKNLTATIKNPKTNKVYFQVVLAFGQWETETETFMIADYTEKDGYFQKHFIGNFIDAYNTFLNRIKIHGNTAFVEYYTKQIGQSEIIWETL